MPPSATTTLMPKSPDLKQLFTLPDTVPAATASTVINAEIRVGGHHPALGRLRIRGCTAICGGRQVIGNGANQTVHLGTPNRYGCSVGRRVRQLLPAPG